MCSWVSLCHVRQGKFDVGAQCLVLLSRMSDKPASPPPIPVRAGSPTEIELWYLQCLEQWWRDRGVGPTVDELAGWIAKSRTALYKALLSLESQGIAGRVGGRGSYARRFIPTSMRHLLKRSKRKVAP